MTDHNHTPGPWKVVPLDNKGIGIDSMSPTGIRGDMDGSVVTGRVYGMANAILISAAPELLRALEGLLIYAELWKQMRDRCGDLSLNGNWFDAMTAARSAIAKARGLS